ncbi:protein kinase [Sorangium cellulosum]|uniref:Protein kinase n=1 Tax=Sorangium cellulosum TaxID=56 RepID=A0A4P2R5R8_SORCE|nr:serine/threonine-protein kinase [Sorangium cellulosum]AUX38011.1 protein kinase [Sorangium cellulosum]
MFPTEPAPETIGAYKILRRLAGSGPTSVYLGRLDGPLGFRRVCVLKLVPNTAEGDPRFADELAREASICASMNHPAIVRMFDFFEHDGRLVLVLEHVEGVNLNRLLQHLAARQQKLADAAVYYLVHCIAGALAHAHGLTDEHGSPAPVIHRNLHPENIVIGWDGQVRLTGFGIGKILGRTPDTIAGVVKGAPGYMAPEQVRAERVTVKADIYGVGLLLWSLLSGRRPPADGTKPPGIASIRPEIPRPVVALLDTALSLSPDDRKTTTQEIEQTLAKVARPEKGKAELVTRVQSAHATIEIEDADPEEDRRPTIPVKGKGGQTARPAAEAAKRLAKDLFAKDQAGREGGAARLRPGGARAGTTPPAPAPTEALAAATRPDGKRSARAPGPEPITIPVPAAPATQAPPTPVAAALPTAVGVKGAEGRKPALPDRETFGRLYEASKRAAERDAAAAEEVLAGGGPATLPEVEPVFEEDDATIPGTGAPSVRFGPSISAIPEAIRFGPPPALPADLTPAFFAPPPPKPPSASPVTPSGVTVPMGTTGLTPPGVAVPVDRTAGGTPPGGVPYPSAAGLRGPPAESSPPPGMRRQRSPTMGWQAPRSLSPAGTIAVSAITATVVAALWIYVARRERPVPAAAAPVEQAAPAAEPVAAATAAPAPSAATSAKRAPGAKAQGKAPSAKELAAQEAAAAKEAAREAAAAKEAAAKEAAAKEAAAKEAAAKEAAAKEKEAAAKEAAAKEAAAKEAAAKEAAAKEAAAKEAAAKEAAAKQAAGQGREGVNPATLPKGQGVLTVGFPEPGGVYVTGKYAGDVNEPLVIRCGRFFVRVGKPGKTKFPEWLSAGVTAQVPCQGATTIDIKPTAPPKPRKKR